MKTAPPASWECQDGDGGACVATSDGIGSRFQEALALVQEADIVIVPVGTFSTEGNDRENLSFSRTKNLCQLEPAESQDELVKAIAKEAKQSTRK